MKIDQRRLNLRHFLSVPVVLNSWVRSCLDGVCVLSRWLMWELFFSTCIQFSFPVEEKTCRLWWAWYWWWSWAIKRLNSSKVHQSPQVRLDFSSNSPRLSTLSAFKTFMIDDPLFLMSLFGRSENLEISTPVKCKKFNFDKNSFPKVININFEQKFENN